MNESPLDDPLLIDRVCDDFEAEWKAGRRPSIESYLDPHPVGLRARLLVELVDLEIEYRKRLGEQPAPADYEGRFGGLAALVLTTFAGHPAQPVTGLDESGAGVTLNVTNGAGGVKTWSFTGHELVLVGRSQQAQVCVNDRHLSRVHFMVEMDPPSCRLTDLGSRNGTLVNGKRVKIVDLKSGDQIKAGHTTLAVGITMPQGAEPAGEAIARQTVDLPAIADGGLPSIEGYRLVRELGRGGMGIVYLAIREEDGSEVALKTIAPSAQAGRKHLDRFLREASILSKLRHTNIVSFRDMGKSGGLAYLTMDYVPGKDAARLLREKGPLPVRVAVRMLAQLLSALEYAHANGFVHRDIKPANMLVTEVEGKKVLKLADFGLARAYQESRLSGLTLQGDVGGTWAFIPPEQITSFRQVKPAADQYSAAASFYNLLTNRFLFDFGPGAEAAINRILFEEPIALLKLRPELSPDLALVTHRALAKKPEDRFPNVRAFLEKLLPHA
jgi:serine/threonine-protein kinase